MSDNCVAFFMSYCELGAMFDYKQDDFNSDSDVERLFIECKNFDTYESKDDFDRAPMCFIYGRGWKFLVERYGYEKLFEINKKVDWINSADIEEFKKEIEKRINEDK